MCIRDSLWSSSSFGIAFVSNWVMTLAVINGLIPTRTIDNWLSAPPLIRLRNPPKSLEPITVSMILFSLLGSATVSYTHLRAHETVLDIVCRLLIETKQNYGRSTTYETLSHQ